MDSSLIALAVPLFFVGIVLEYTAARRRGLCVYRLNDAIANLSCGMFSQLAALLWGAVQLSLYAATFRHARALDLDAAPALQWALAFVGVDLIYYWWHRLSHTVNLLWAAHVVHHQSEEYNLAVALRQAVLTSWTGLPFHLPLAMLGVAPAVYATVLALSTLYQFWIHTRLVRPVRAPIGRVLNLPSHHRVHHAVNPRYLDKNFGATLIVWDRLFGTFVEEDEVPRYGITRPLASFNPLWAQLQAWVELARAAARARTVSGAARIVFGSPALVHPEEPSLRASAPVSARFDPKVGSGASIYAATSLAPLVAGTTALMMWGGRLAPAVQAGAIALTVIGLVGIGAVLEGRRWAAPLELARTLLSVAFVAAIVA